jgi:GNAT superfamily N-acetyltransferase
MVAYRQAELNEAVEILELLKAVAPEIPIALDTRGQEEKVYPVIRNCARSGASWVAVDEANRIVGFVLVMPTEARRHYGENETRELHYAGVAHEHRRRGIFRELIGKVFARLAPVTVTIPPSYRPQIGTCLEAVGFRKPVAGEYQYRWQPGN